MKIYVQCLFLLFVFLVVSFSTSAQTFERMPGGAIDVAMNPATGKVYVVGTSKNVFSWNESQKKFIRVGNTVKAQEVAATTDGKIWIIDEKKAVYRSSGSSWQKVNPLMVGRHITADTQGKPWVCFAPNGKPTYWDGSKWEFPRPLLGYFNKLALSNASDVWAIDQNNAIKRFTNNRWNTLPGGAIDIAVDARTGVAYCIGTSKRIFKWSNGQKNWLVLPGTRSDLVGLAVHNGVIWCISQSNAIYRIKPEATNNTNFSFASNKPKVVVMVHGITVSEKTTDAGVEEGVNTPAHPQYYWGFDFMKHVIQSQYGNMQIIRPGQSRSVYLGINKPRWANHHRRAGLNDGNAVVIRGTNAQAEIMCTYRDGAMTLIDQTKEAINQIYNTYQAHYGHLSADRQPMIYLVAHSFGGIVCRTILSNPTGADLSGDRLNATDRKRADFIRNRTVWLTTLATPHEGSPIPELAQDIDRKLGELRPFLPTQFLKEKIDDTRNNAVTGNRPSLNDIKRNDVYLKGWLKPELARRTDGELIPIYTLSGSNPSHTYFLSSRPAATLTGNSFTDLLQNYSDKIGYNKAVGESFSLLLIDVLAKAALKPQVGLWPKAYTAVPETDRFKTPYYGVAKTVSVGELSFTASTAVPLVSALTTTGIWISMSRDGYMDSDGFVAFSSGHGLKLGTNELGYFGNDRTYQTGGKYRAGSWYRIYGDKYGKSHPWDYDNHRSICFNEGTGAFIGNYLLAKSGPYSRKGRWSTWDGQNSVNDMGTKTVRLEFTLVEDLTGKLDRNLPRFRQADFRAQVRIGHGKWQESGTKDNDDKLNSADFQPGKPYIWVFKQQVPNATIVPVIVRIWDEDSADPDDLCSLSRSNPYQEEIVIYVDTQNGKIYGEFEALTGPNSHVVQCGLQSKNPVKVGFRVKIE